MKGDEILAPTSRLGTRYSVPAGDVIVIDERCKGCAFCVEYCPRDVLEMSTSFNRKGYHPPDVIKTASASTATSAR